MNQHLDGKGFVALVSATVHRELKYGELIGTLFDACGESGTLMIFGDLAFNAKSFQKLRRLLSAGISDDNTRIKLVRETEETFRRFLSLLEKASGCFDEGEQRRFKNEFLNASPDSFEKATSLLDDFATVKDFYLIKRDEGEMK